MLVGGGKEMKYSVFVFSFQTCTKILFMCQNARIALIIIGLNFADIWVIFFTLFLSSNFLQPFEDTIQDRPYQCSQCPSAFSRKPYLDIHMRVKLFLLFDWMFSWDFIIFNAIDSYGRAAVSMWYLLKALQSKVFVERTQDDSLWWVSNFSSLLNSPVLHEKSFMENHEKLKSQCSFSKDSEVLVQFIELRFHC